MDDFMKKLVAVRPSQRQVAWQSLEFTAFFHYGINTYTDAEWGSGREDPKLYNPSNLDTDQWCQSIKAAGITACIITAKHHDGFCLFDSAYTKYSVMSSPKPVDVVASLAASCAKYDLKMGVYLSPWDRNHPAYGSGKAYDDYFCAQLEELTTKYGPLYSLWFDGACGEGANGKRQVYDWPRYFELIRKNQPDAALSICGPDVRWIGNEAGYTRPSEWSVVHERMTNAEKTATISQQSDEESFRDLRIASEDEDLGSRTRLAKELEKGGELCWYPAEVDVSIRPGWFYHSEEDDKVKSLDQLMHIYETSVGGNALLLLNIPPDTTGQIYQADQKRLQELGDRIRSIYSENLFEGANIVANDEKTTIEISLEAPITLTHMVLQEDILQSQRIEAFELSVLQGDAWEKLYEGMTVGYKKICSFEAVVGKEFRIHITESRSTPILNFVGAYIAKG